MSPCYEDQQSRQNQSVMFEVRTVVNLGCGGVLLLFQTCCLIGVLVTFTGVVCPVKIHHAVNLQCVHFCPCVTPQ